ncbi:MAG: PEP-CTERM system TPR-repeat protein PrsT [Alishewanella agri]|nr:PEP-CTERM system TPR-repeat protein PrsT [Alishewanella agri]
MKKTCLSAAIALSLLLSGCGGKSAEDHFSAGTSFAEQQKLSEAIIELKSAVAAAPNNAAYRLFLGRLYMQSGDYFSAEKELARALDNGADVNEVALDLLQANFRAENYQQVLGLFKDDQRLTDSKQQYATLYRALTEIEMGTADNAMPLFDSLVESSSPDIQAFAKAMLQIKNNAPAEALAILEQTTTDSPAALEITYYKAQLAQALGNDETALAGFYQYLQSVPTALRTRLTVAQLELKAQRLDKAQAELDQILRFAPEHGLTNYLRALVAFENKEFNKAKEHIDKAIGSRFNTTASRIMAGLIHHQLGLNTQALAHLASVQSQLGVYPPAQRLLTALQLQAGELTQAAGSIGNVELTEQDVNLAAVTAFELLKAGETTMANDILKRIEEAGLNQNSANLATLGQLRLGIPEQMSAGIRDLEQALMLDPARHDARLTLAASYIRQQQYDKAAALADEWLTQPETANAGYNLKALAALLSGKLDEASTLLVNAGQADPKNPFTHYLQAAIAQQQQDTAKATELLTQAVTHQPEYVPALMGLYGLERVQQQDTAKVIELIRNTQQQFPDNPAVLGLLVNVYQFENDHEAVVKLLEPRLNTPEQLTPFVMSALATAYGALRKLPETLALTERWYKQDERNQQAALAYANALALSNKHKDALSIIDNLLRRTSNNNDLRYIRFMLLAEAGEFANALTAFEQLPEELTATPQMQFQRGRLQLLNGQITPGLATLQASYNAAPEPATAIAIAEALAKDVSFRRAIRFLEEHFDKHGQDPRVYSFYGSLLVQDDITKAKQIYADIFQNDPENPLILNNYAWILASSGEVTQAQPYAEKALSKLPQHPDILDTYGKILKLQGQHKEAIAQFEKSLTIRPNHPEVQLNYVESLIQVGNSAKAREVLANVKAETAEHKARQQQLSTLL